MLCFSESVIVQVYLTLVKVTPSRWLRSYPQVKFSALSISVIKTRGRIYQIYLNLSHVQVKANVTSNLEIEMKLDKPYIFIHLLTLYHGTLMLQINQICQVIWLNS